MPTEEVLANAKRKIFAEIKFEMDKRGYTTTSLAELLNVNRPTVSSAIHGGTTPKDVEIRKKIYKIFGMDIWAWIKKSKKSVDRNVLEKIEVGIYKPFNLIPKYGNKAIYDAIFLFHKE